MRLATWNVNSIRARLGAVIDWLDTARPDVVCLQEIKTVNETFPHDEFARMGYHVAVHGQKSYNGVALLSKYPLDDVVTALPGEGDDAQARYIEADILIGERMARVASLYLPNGNPISDGTKFAYKSAWIARLTAHAERLMEQEIPVILAGDYNVIPTPDDVYDTSLWVDDALFHPRIRAAFRGLLHLGYTDALRACNPSSHCYSFWDYQRGDWEHDRGLRIDHVLLSPMAADQLLACGIDRRPRGEKRPSDHTPVWVELDF